MLKNFIAKIGARHGAEEPAGKPDEPSNDGPPSQLPQQQGQVAQPEQEQQKQHAQHQPASSASAPVDAKCSIFFARVPPTITHEQLLAVFGCFGQVAALNLFRPFADAKTSKGCGIVTFDSAASATAAKEQLHGQFRFNADGPSMVVEGVNESKMRSTVGTPGSSGSLFKPKSQSKASSNRAVRANSSSASSSSSSGAASATAEAPTAVAAAARPAAAGPAGQAAGATPPDTSSAVLKDQQQQQQQQQQGPKPTAAGQARRWHEQQQQSWQPPLPAACNAPMSAGPMQLLPMALMQQQQQQAQSSENMPSGLRSAPTPFPGDASQPSGLSCSSSAGGSNQFPQQMMAAGSGAGTGAGQDLVQAFQACRLAQSRGNSGQLTQLTGDEAYVPTFRPLPGINNAAALQPGGWPQQLLLQQQQQIAAAGAADANRFCSVGSSGICSSGRPLAGGLGQPMAPLPRQAGLFDVPVPAQQSEQQLLLAAAAAAAGIPSRNTASSVSGGLLLPPSSAYSEHSQSQQRFSQLSVFSVLDTSGPGSALPDFLSSQGGLFSGEGHAVNNNIHNSGCCLSGGGFSGGYGGYGGYGAGGQDDIASAPALLLGGKAATAGSAASLQCNALLLQQQQQQQHALSGGCNVQQSAATATGGLGCTGTLSGVFAARNLPLQEQQQQLQEDGWFGSSSGGGYFDLYTSSSGSSNPNIAATASASGGSSAASNMQHQQQQGLRSVHQGNSAELGAGGGFNGRAAAAAAGTGLLQQRSGASASASQMRVLLQQEQHQLLLQSHCNANYVNSSAGDAGQGVLPAAAAAAAVADGGGAGSGIVRIPVGCGNAVVGVLAAHMSAVSQLSGAAVSIEAPGDELMVWATGRPDQVAMARAIIQVMLEKSQNEAAAAVAGGGAC